MVLVVVFAFVMCWAPFFIVTLVNYFLKILSNSNFVFWQSVLLLFGFSNSCMNPIIYAFMSRAFRRGFRGIIVCFCPCTKPCFKNRGKFGKPRPSVTIISSEPATEACRVGGDSCPRGKRRRAPPDRTSRWNNTQYSAVSETEAIDMTRLPGNNANGGPCDHHHHNRQPKTSEDSFTTSILPTDSGSTGSHNPSWTPSSRPCIREQEEEKPDHAPFEDVTLDDETQQRNIVTDCNQNAPDHPTKHHHGLKQDTAEAGNRHGQLPIIQNTEDSFRIENIGE